MEPSKRRGSETRKEQLETFNPGEKTNTSDWEGPDRTAVAFAMQVEVVYFWGSLGGGGAPGERCALFRAPPPTDRWVT